MRALPRYSGVRVCANDECQNGQHLTSSRTKAAEIAVKRQHVVCETTRPCFCHASDPEVWPTDAETFRFIRARATLPPNVCNTQIPHSPHLAITTMHDSTPYRYDLGSFHRKISTSSPKAQEWFDRGLVWCYAFHHEESARCFERAIDEDSTCAIAYWGVGR